MSDAANMEERVPEQTLAISFFDPAREAFLEYDISKLLYELNQAQQAIDRRHQFAAGGRKSRA